MGCCFGKSVYVKYRHLAKWKLEFDALRLTQNEIENLYKIFKKVCSIPIYT